jgi:hypothetical protein
MTMNKKTALVLVTLIILTGLCLQYAAAGEAPYKDINCQENGFTIQAPSNWEVQKNAFGTHLVLLCSTTLASSTFRENVNVISEIVPENLSVDEYVKTALGHLKQVPDHKLLGSKSLVINGLQARMISSTFSHQGMKIRNSQYIIKSGKKVYVITSTALVDSYEKFSPTFDNIARTFKVK